MGFIFFLPIVLAVTIIVLMLLLTAAAAITIGIGGVSFSMFVKNKNIKRLLLIGFLIILFFGLLCLCPFIVFYMGLSASLIPWFMGLACVCIGLLSVLGARLSKAIEQKIVRLILTVLFYIVLVADIILILFIIFATLYVS